MSEYRVGEVGPEVIGDRARYFPAEYDALSVDEVIDRMWTLYLGTDDDADCVTIRPRCDQWWGVYVECDHGKAKGYSRGPLDLSNAFRHALVEFVALHGRKDDTA